MNNEMKMKAGLPEVSAGSTMPWLRTGAGQDEQQTASASSECQKGLTFLFTDIEGSTRLWADHPEAMNRALAEHDRILRAAIESREGKVFKLVGDAVLASFGCTSSALRAAMAAQRALRARDRGLKAGEIALADRVRIGMHFGEAYRRAEDFLGLDVCKAARIVAAGHGGQILISREAQGALVSDLPDDCRLLNLGRYRLPGFRKPVHIHQILPIDLPQVDTRLRADALAETRLLLMLRWLARVWRKRVGRPPRPEVGMEAGLAPVEN